jgi:lysophospholipase L1-like esterase
VSRLLSIVVKNAIVLVAIEGVVRAVVALGVVTLPSTEILGFDRARQGQNAPEEKRLYQVDRDLIFALRPNAHLVYDRTIIFGPQEKYEVRTNSWGFRTFEFTERKKPGVFRIVCLGDSSTFGFNVEERDAYPAVLARLLEEAQPNRFEVLNLGVPGYSSRQGLELIRQRVLELEPDLVTFAFGTNDRFWWRPLSDDRMIRLSQSPTGAVIFSTRQALDHVFAYRFLKAGLVYLMHGLIDPRLGQDRGEQRVSLEGIADAIVEAQGALARMGAALVVLNNDFILTDAVLGIRTGAERAGVPYLDMQRAFAEARREQTRRIEAERGLPPLHASEGVLFRVRASAAKREILLEYGPMPSLKLTTVPMRDDGSAGDQVARDGIWTVRVPALPTERASHTYWERTNGQLVREYRVTLPPSALRVQMVPESGGGDIDTYGEYYLHSDNSHPDEDGHRLIAGHLLPVVLDRIPKQAGRHPVENTSQAMPPPG